MWRGVLSSRNGGFRARGRPESPASGPLGATLRAIRHRADISQETHAARAHLHQSSISRIESGYQKPHKISTLRRLALGVAAYAAQLIDAAGLGDRPRHGRRDGQRRQGPGMPVRVAGIRDPEPRGVT